MKQTNENDKQDLGRVPDVFDTSGAAEACEHVSETNEPQINEASREATGSVYWQERLLQQEGFEPSTNERFWDLLEAVPPVFMKQKAFACGEPYSYDDKGRDTYDCFVALHEDAEGNYTHVWHKVVALTPFKAVLNMLANPINFLKDQEGVKL